MAKSNARGNANKSSVTGVKTSKSGGTAGKADKTERTAGTGRKSSSTGGKASRSSSGGERADKSSSAARKATGRSNTAALFDELSTANVSTRQSNKVERLSSTAVTFSNRPSLGTTKSAMIRETLVSAGLGRAEAQAVAAEPRCEDTTKLVRRALYHMARRAFPSDAALAEAIGVHRSQVSRWKEGDAARPENAWVLRDLAFAVETLSEHLDGATIRAWLNGYSPELDGEMPIDSIRGGRLADVLMAFQAQVGGSYH